MAPDPMVNVTINAVVLMKLCMDLAKEYTLLLVASTSFGFFLNKYQEKV